MKKIHMAICGILVMCCMLTFLGCEIVEPEEPTTEERTYCGTVYDAAYTFDKPDGLRCRAYYCMMFNESDHTVIQVVHLTAGNGRTRTYEGTYEGDLKESVTVTIKGEATTYYCDGTHLVSEAGDDFSSISVVDGILKINRW